MFRVGGEGQIGEHRGFLRQWKYSAWYHNDKYAIIQLSKPIECTTPRVNCNANYGLWMIMICQCKLVSSNKCSTVGRDTNNGGGYASMEAEDLWEISVP